MSFASNSAKPSGPGNPLTRNGKAADRAALNYGSVASGTITAVNMVKKSYTVALDNAVGAPISGCKWLAGVFSAMFGMKTSFSPQRGSRVALMLGNPSFILGITGAVPLSEYNGRRATNVEGATTSSADWDENADDEVHKHHNEPSDMLEGEFELANELSVGIQFLTTITKMQAGERARVECHLLRDMVRVFSDTFEHFSAFGDYQIYEDGGRVNVRWNGTAYEHEAWGQLDSSSPKAKVDRDDVSGVCETGRWRFAAYMGFLGDFMHMFVTEPEKALGSLAQAGCGKSRIQQHSDGSVLVQSVADIVLERVCRIAVPVELKRPEDKEGNSNADYKNLDEKFLKIWNFGSDFDNVHETVYQLREYARWLSDFQGYARFHQLNKDWKIPVQSDVPEPSWTNGEKDREQANPGVKYKDVYSCYRIMRDGSQVMFDGSGSAVVMSCGNVQLSAAKHMTIEAAGDIRIRAGQNIYMLARRNIEISAVVGGIIGKARTLMRLFCEWGSIHIKSDANLKNPKKLSDQADSTQDPAPEVLEHSIVIDAPVEGAIALNTVQKIAMAVSDGSVGMKAKQHIALQSEEDSVLVSAKKLIQMRAETFLATLTKLVELRAPIIDFDRGAATFRRLKGMWSFNKIVSRTVTGNFYGPKLGAAPDPDSPSDKPIPPHLNHINKVADKADLVPKLIESSELTDVVEADAQLTKKLPGNIFKKPPVLGLFGESDYVKEADKLDKLYQTLTQQTLSSLSGDAATAYGDLNFSNDIKLQTGLRTLPHHPHVGKTSTHMVHETNAPGMQELDSRAHSEKSKQTPLRPKSVLFKFLKRP